MKKRNYLIAGIFIVAIAIYNLVLFSLNTEFTAIFWSSYGFTMFAFISSAILFMLLIGFNCHIDDALLNMPVVIVHMLYVLLQLILGITIIIIPILSLRSVNTIQIVIILLTIMIDLVCLVGRSITK